MLMKILLDKNLPTKELKRAPEMIDISTTSYVIFRFRFSSMLKSASLVSCFVREKARKKLTDIVHRLMMTWRIMITKIPHIPP